MEIKPSFNFLKPYIRIRLSPDELNYEIFVYFRKDAEDQKIILDESHSSPPYPNPTRVITIKACNAKRETSKEFFHMEYIEIPVAHRAKYESLVHVIVKHDHINHGGSGTVHFPPPPGVGG